MRGSGWEIRIAVCRVGLNNHSVQPQWRKVSATAAQAPRPLSWTEPAAKASWKGWMTRQAQQSFPRVGIRELVL